MKKGKKKTCCYWSSLVSKKPVLVRVTIFTYLNDGPKIPMLPLMDQMFLVPGMVWIIMLILMGETTVRAGLRLDCVIILDLMGKTAAGLRLDRSVSR